MPVAYFSGTETTSRSLAVFSTRSIGMPAPELLVAGPTRDPGCTFRSVTMPSRGARTWRYPSISMTDFFARLQALRESAEAAKSALKSVIEIEGYLQVRAPLDGIVTERNVHPGSPVGPATRSEE